MPTRAERAEPATVAFSGEELRLLDGWWRAANYLSVGQIYLLENPLLRSPPEEIAETIVDLIEQPDPPPLATVG